MAKEFKYIAIARKIYSDYCLQLNVGDRLPTTLEICDIYNTSEITAKKAFSLLAEEGFIKRAPRKGTVLAKKDPQSSFVSGQQTTLDVLCIDGGNLPEVMDKITAGYCSSHGNVNFNIQLVKENDLKRFFLRNTPDLTVASGICIREFMSDPKTASNLLSLDDLQGLQFNEGMYLPQVLGSCRDNSGIKAFPLNVSTVLSFINTEYPELDEKLFDSPMNFARFREILTQCRPNANSEFPYPFYIFYSRNRWPIVVKNFGGDVFSEDGRRCLLDQKPAIEALKYLIDIIFRDNLCFPSAIVEGFECINGAYNLFKYNTFLCTWGTFGMCHTQYATKTKIAPLPCEQKPFTPLLTTGVLVNRKTKSKEAVRDFLNYLQLFENQQIITDMSDGFSCQKSIAKQLSATKAREISGFENFISSLEYAEPLFKTPRFSLIQMIHQMLYPVWLGIRPVEQTCRETAAIINKMLSEDFDSL
jgi:ABC-type glycerol-3-phosphate transport system substrate-binding protein